MKLFKAIDAIKNSKIVDDIKNSKIVGDIKEQLKEELANAKVEIREGLKELRSDIESGIKEGTETLKESRYLKETLCPMCGNKASLLTGGKELLDGSIVCFDCVNKVPSYIKFYFGDCYTSETAQALKEYMNYSFNELRPKFCETACYQKVHIDEVNGLFYIENDQYDPIVYSEFKNVTNFEISFEGDDARKTLFGPKMFGQVYIRIDVSNPPYSFEGLGKDKGDIKTNMIHTEMWYEPPKAMVDFMMRFETAKNRFSEFDFNSYSDEGWYDYSQYEQYTDTSKVQKAKEIFGFSDMEGFTLEELDKQYKKLMRKYHPDVNKDANATQFAQDINEAYDILKQTL